MVIGAGRGETDGGGGVAFGEPALEFGADSGLEFDDARKVGGFPLREFGGELDGGGRAGGRIGSEVVDGGDDALGVEMPLG